MGYVIAYMCVKYYVSLSIKKPPKGKKLNIFSMEIIHVSLNGFQIYMNQVVKVVRGSRTVSEVFPTQKRSSDTPTAQHPRDAHGTIR